MNEPLCLLCLIEGQQGQNENMFRCFKELRASYTGRHSQLICLSSCLLGIPDLVAASLRATRRALQEFIQNERFL